MMEIDTSQIHPFTLIDRLLYQSRGAKGYVKYPYIRFRKDIYQNLISPNPDPENVGMLLHELEHIKRMKELGVLKFKLLYIFSPKFRLQEEMSADRARFKYFKSNGVQFDFTKRAKLLSSFLYFWMISYKKALEILQGVWEEL